MGSELPNASLDSLCELIADCPHSTPVWTSNGVIVLRSQNIRGGRLDLSSASYTDEEHYKDRTRRAEPRGGDLVITREAPMGEVCQIPMNLRCCLGQRMVLLRPDHSEVDARYLLFALQSRVVQTQIMWAEGTGSTVSNLRIPDLKKLQIPLPPMAEQRAIADILGTLDDKIELNRQMNRTLEAMARAIFKAWFVDFEPVKAKAAGATSFRGMPQSVFDDLPGRFTDSEVGPVPVGWSCVPIEDLVTVVGGATPSTKEEAYWKDGKHPFCTPKDMSRLESPVLLDTQRCITDHGLKKISSGQLPAGTVLLSSRAPIGYLAISETPVSVNQGIIAMHCESGSNLYVLFWAEENMGTIKAHAGGSTFAEISKRNFRPLPAVLPPVQTLLAFDSLVRPFYERIVSNLRESATLTQARDALLPELLSGKAKP